MPELSPRLASELAREVYSVVGDDMSLKLFLSRSEFSKTPNASKQLTATVGTRLIKKDKQDTHPKKISLKTKR